MSQMEVNIISPEEEIFSGTSDMVVIPGEEGDFAAMYEHAPIITYMRPGTLKVNLDNKDELDTTYFVGGGFVKVEDNKCLIMVDYIKKVSDINVKINEQEIATLKDKLNTEENNIEKNNINKDIHILQSELDLVSGK